MCSVCFCVVFLVFFVGFFGVLCVCHVKESIYLNSIAIKSEVSRQIWKTFWTVDAKT